MAHHKQTAKRNRQNIKARIKNKEQRTAMRTAVRRVRNATTPDAAKGGLSEMMKKVDKAAKARVIHPNAAARLKSRLAKKVAAVGAK